MKRVFPYLIFLLLTAYYVVAHPTHACFGKEPITNFKNPQHWGTLCFVSKNIYDFNDEKAKKIVIPANLYLPDNLEKPVPAIIMSHGAGGIFRFHHKYKRIFLREGFAVLMIDHFHPRGKILDDNFVDITEPMMISDTIAAYNLLKEHPSISGKIGYVGWSKGGIGTILLKDKRILKKFNLDEKSFNFLVGIYTFCGFELDEKNISKTPLLLISGEEDSITPAHQCKSMTEKFKIIHNTKYVEIEKAHHGFDNYAFYLGAYIPWQPIITDFSKNCVIKINDSYETTNLNESLKLNSLKNRSAFIKSCTESGAYVAYSSKAAMLAEETLIDFVKNNF
ncbi:MAG: dienelactone hydrolase family protein [Pseudomonadota bacterium]|nr:dienelactone hydrolase family protein [Pseudomonadota bacterium]